MPPGTSFLRIAYCRALSAEGHPPLDRPATFGVVHSEKSTPTNYYYSVIISIIATISVGAGAADRRAPDQ